MCLSFYEAGHAKAEQDINSHEQNPLAILHTEIKPFTTKVPAHMLESLDIVASGLNMTRNAFVTKLIELYLPQAFTEYSLGYGRVFSQPEKSDEQLVLSDLDELLSRTEGVSNEASQYLKAVITKHLIDS